MQGSVPRWISLLAAIEYIRRVTKGRQGWHELWSLLANGSIKGRYRGVQRRYVPPIPWDRVRRVDHNGDVEFDDPPELPSLSRLPPSEPVQIDIDQEDLLRYWPDEQAEADTAPGVEVKNAGDKISALPPNVLPSSEKPRRRATGRGRRPHPIWEEEVREKVFESLEYTGVPIAGDGEQAELEEFVANILVKRRIEDASRSTIRRHVKRYIGEYQASKTGS